MALKRTTLSLLAASAVVLTACGDDQPPHIGAQLRHIRAEVHVRGIAGVPAQTMDALYDPASTSYSIRYSTTRRTVGRFSGRDGESSQAYEGREEDFPITALSGDGTPLLHAIEFVHGRQVQTTVVVRRDEQVPRTPARVERLAGR